MRLKEIEKRLSSIKTEIDQDGADLNALETEIKTLKEERSAILEKAEKRKSLMDEVANMPETHLEVVKTFKPESEERKMEFNKENVLKSKEYRSAWAKTLMCQELNEVEKRALGTALTTTSPTYVSATAQVDGVNNGGLFIPEEVNNALMQAISLASPFFSDVAKTSISGIVKFPYRVSGSGAEAQVEGVPNKDGQVQWAELTLTTLEVSETIRVTWKLEAMSVDGFIDYIIQELTEQVRDAIVTGVLYGNGSNTLTGVTNNAIDGSYTIGSSTGNVKDVLGAIESGLKLLPKKKKIGAKIYVSTDIVETISFLRDSTGNFVYNPINAGGINSVATYKVEVDPFLNAGHFIIGNGRYYRFNTNEPLSVTKDVSGKARINDYTGYAIVSGKAEPNSFVHGKPAAQG